MRPSVFLFFPINLRALRHRRSVQKQGEPDRSPAPQSGSPAPGETKRLAIGLPELENHAI